ncbi:unnamed protein product [Rodentolepis nana]|uniref:Uncharacterized protein n=1 Tax=Rodentolepis nana TaxID=102285 RepID=A0A0R3T0E7_RODNA|nr:unnamed protein product [Rodentolepis nana]
MNNIDFEEDRTRAIQQTLDKNPSAFYPKIEAATVRDRVASKITANVLKSFVNPDFLSGFDAYITPGLIEVVCSCMLSQLILSESGINQEAIILVEFAKFLEHVLKSMTIQIKNEQINYFSFVESPSKGNTTISLLNNETAPYSTSTGYSDDITNDTNAVTLAEQSNLIGRSNECTKSAQTLSKYHTFSEINYETIQPSFRSFLSSNEEAETQRVYGNCGIPFSSESTILPSNYQFTTQPHLVPVVPLDPTIQNDNMVAEILPYEQTVLGSVSAENYSSEADLAVAAISSEMSSSNSECNSIYGFQDCGPDYCSSYTAL